MKRECEYFDSQRWNQRIQAHVGRVWDVETALRKLDFEDAQTRIQALAATHNMNPEEIARKTVGEATESELLADSNLELTDAVTRWRSEQTWLPDKCPHAAVAEDAHCPFHTPPGEYERVGLTPTTVEDALQTELTSDTERPACFVGAHLQTVDLADIRIQASNAKLVDFRLATIDDEVVCSSSVIAPPVSFEGAKLCEEDRSPPVGTGTAANRYISVDARIDFSGTHFEDSVDFKHTYFASTTSFNGATFDDIAMFNYATMHGAFEFWATAEGKADFSKATFRETAQLRGDYRTAGIFNYTTFYDDVVLWNSNFNGKAEFLAAEFHGTVDCSHATFRGFTRFCETTFESGAMFQAAQFKDRVHFRRIRAPDTVISLTEAFLSAGNLEWDSPKAHFDMADATIGRVALTETHENDIPGSPFEYLSISRTDFDQFDFGRYATGLKPDWRLETRSETWPVDFEPSHPSELAKLEAREDSYLRAKSGANQAGHNKAASEFFRHEMKYRRKQYAALFKNRFNSLLIDEPTTGRGMAKAVLKAVGRTPIDVSRRLLPRVRMRARTRGETPGWQSGYRWIANSILGLVSGYGERPQRPIIMSFVIICLFAVAYALLGVKTPVDNGSGSGYLLLSIQSFITFILGSSPVGTGQAAQFLSAIEGFAGAFFIAIFVFTLTRSIHR